MRSFNPNDVREGYCGNCHDWTGGDPPGPRPSLGEYAPPELLSPFDAWLLSLSIWLMAKATHLPGEAIRRVLGWPAGN